jgi:uncharacterized protein DUF4082
MSTTMNRRTDLTVAAAFSLFAMIPATSHASPIVNLSTPGSTYGSSLYTLGFEFSVSSPQSITQLGVYDNGGGVLPTDASVGLWNTSGTLLTSVTVPAAGGTVIGDFRYANITPYALTSGTDYIIGSYLGSTGIASSLNTGQGGSGSYNPLVTVIQDQYSNFNSAFSFPGTTTPDPGGAWLGANANLSATPLPAALPLFGSGLLGLIALGRRRMRKNTTTAAAA